MEKANNDDGREPGPPDGRMPDYDYTYDPVAAAAQLPPEPPPPPCPACGGLGEVVLLTSSRLCRSCGGSGSTAPPPKAWVKQLTFDAQDRVVRTAFSPKPEPKRRGADL
jgi:hypothetical protein